MVLHFLPADAAGFEAPRGQNLGLRRVGAVARLPETAEAARNRFAAFGDCMELAFAGLMMLAALLFAAGLLRYGWGVTLGGVADFVYGLAAAMGCATLGVFGRGMMYLRK